MTNLPAPTRIKLTLPQYTSWIKNIVYFSAPALAVFFGQLALKVPLREAAMVALLAAYGIIADYLKKFKQG